MVESFCKTICLGVVGRSGLVDDRQNVEDVLQQLRKKPMAAIAHGDLKRTMTEEDIVYEKAGNFFERPLG